jgi:FKBP-type peptidyl-prolyl cis-trans isomerase
MIRQYLLLALFLPATLALQQQQQQNRRAFFQSAAATVATGVVLVVAPPTQPALAAGNPPTLKFVTDVKSGIQWADAKVGSGPETKSGSIVSIDYVLSTTGARYGAKIYGTAEQGQPYRWKLGDGSTIVGLEQAIVGGTDGGITPMRPGGIRRVIIPPGLAYESLGVNASCKGVGPLPPVPEAFEEFQRFKNIYCNPNRAYQPDIVMDIKLYGKRTSE